jgi:general L-amino acid transport system permease protein
MSAAAVGDEAWRSRQRAAPAARMAAAGRASPRRRRLIAGLAQNVAANLEARQIKSGFGFLRDPAGFNIGELLFDYSARDSYLRAFAVGMANTLRVSIAGIVLASVLGVLVGLMRLSHHGLVAWLGSAWVEVFRNTPLLIQLLTIYLLGHRAAARFVGADLDRRDRAAVQAGPADRGAGRGNDGPRRRRRRRLARRRGGVRGGAALAAGRRRAARRGRRRWRRALAWLAFGAIDGWSRPELDGFLISGGASLTPEFLALWLGLSLFTSASIAELVRAGALAVPVGQWNARSRSG